MTTELATYGLSDAQRIILNQTTPKDAIKYRQGRGNTRLAYVTHAWVNGLLNQAFGHRWDWQVLDTLIVPDSANPLEVIVKGRLTVYLPDGTQIVKEQFGASDVKRTKQGDVLSLGDDLKAASSDALKKAASLLGVALDLYGPRYDDDLGPEPEPGGKVIDGKASAPATKPAAQPSTAKSTYSTPTQAQKPVQRDDFDELPGHERSAYTVPQRSGVDTKPANGNGHAKVEVETANRPKWKSPQEAQAWAMSLGAFDHDKHCANAYDKLRRTALASEKPPTSAAEFFDLWYADVVKRLAEKHAEIDALAAGSEIPNF